MLRLHTHGPVSRLTMARTALGQPLYTVECYWVDGWLIDTGLPATGAEIVRFARERREAMRGVVNTHHHEDHSGGDAALHQAFGFVPRVPAKTIPILAAPPRLEPYRWVIWGQPQPVHAEPLGERLETEHYDFQIIPTPGHCDDHVCLLEVNQGWLFSGDLYIGERVKYLRADEDARTELDSLRHVLSLDFETLFCSHAGVVPDVKAALRRKLNYWEDIQGRAQEMARGGASLKAICDALLGPEGRMTPITRGHFSKLNLIRSLVG